MLRAMSGRERISPANVRSSARFVGKGLENRRAEVPRDQASMTALCRRNRQRERTIRWLRSRPAITNSNKLKVGGDLV